MLGIETNLAYVLGTDQQYAFTIYTDDTEAVVRDFSGFALSFMLKRKLSDADASALLTKTTVSGIAIAGSFNASPSVNTLKATVTISKADFPETKPGETVFWELKRTDTGQKARHGYGSMELVRSVHRA